MSEKYCTNNNSDNPLTSRRTDGGKNVLQRRSRKAFIGFTATTTGL